MKLFTVHLKTVALNLFFLSYCTIKLAALLQIDEVKVSNCTLQYIYLSYRCQQKSILHGLVGRQPEV